MTIRQGLLALLVEGDPRYGYQLKSDFETRTSSVWPLNVGQVYTTLARLERDGLVAVDADGSDGSKTYRLTDEGRGAVQDWFAAPVTRDTAPRDELAMKVVLALSAPAVEVAEVIQAQRSATLRALQDYTALKREADPATELAWLLVLDAQILAAEAEVRWLDLCEAD